MKRFEIIDIVWIFLSFLIPKFLLASECVFDVDLTLSTKTQDIFHSCNSMSENNQKCLAQSQAPCLPKCCPLGHELKRNDKNGKNHGFECVISSSSSIPWKNNITVPISGYAISEFSQQQQTFYAGIFPFCDGLLAPAEDWIYDLSEENFEMDFLAVDEYKFYSRNKSIEVLGQEANEESDVYLIHYCFDILKEKSVALTCPKSKLSKPISKCCPIGKAYKYFENTGGKCVNETEKNNVWIPINGHLFDEKILSDEGLLIHTNDTEFLINSNSMDTGYCKPIHTSYSYWFNIGPDGKLHRTDLHETPASKFCIEKELTELEEEEENSGNYEKTPFVFYCAETPTQTTSTMTSTKITKPTTAVVSSTMPTNTTTRTSSDIFGFLMAAFSSEFIRTSLWSF